MRKIYTILLAVFVSAGVLAQAPQKMSYQSVIRNSSNQLVTSHGVGMRVSILQGSASGTAVYVETQTPTTNANGLATIEIGGGTPVTGTFAGIDWSSGTYYIKTETDPNGSTSYTITGTSQLLSVPYTLYAKTSADVPGMKQQIKILEDNLIAAGTYKLSDIEGNQYNVVKIGNQVWMKENLTTTKYNDGTSLPNITDNSSWTAATTGAYSDFDNNPSNSITYGRLYNWYAVDNNTITRVANNGGKNVCPTGWHVPNDAEWTTLTTYLGGESIAGGKLKETGTTHWITPNTGATNESGFTAIPGGHRYNDGTYYSIGFGSGWWSSTERSTTDSWSRTINYNATSVARFYYGLQDGFSVRCLRD